MSAVAPQLRLAGIVLAGGRSTRFGSEKAVALFRGRPMMEWSLAALAGACEAVAISAPAASGAAALARERGLPVLPDDPAHPSGPLAGVAAGLAWARANGFTHLATLPCDTPLVTDAEIARLWDVGANGAYAVTGSGAHPLIAIWPVELLVPLATRLATGDHPAVQAILAESAAKAATSCETSQFMNANVRDTPGVDG